MDSVLLREIIMKDDIKINKKTMFGSREEDVIKTTIYKLLYRIDEDRFWYSKEEDGEIVEEHHMKNGLFKSMEIMDGIFNRLKSFNGEDRIIDNYLLTDEIKFKILNYRRDEDVISDRNIKPRLEGILLK